MNRHPILLVEDDENDVFFMEDALQRTGVTNPLHIARDGEDAIQYFASSEHTASSGEKLWPCLVLLDLNLPRRTGFEVLKWIRAQPAWKTLIVIVMTSSMAESDRHTAYALGANSYLVKPADATQLRELTQLFKQYWLQWNQAPPKQRADSALNLKDAPVDPARPSL